MGLLDDAIREHLELKRLNGADPGVVAREERDALGPVGREGEAQNEGREDGEVGLPHDGGSISHDSGPRRALESSTAGQETVEINMEAEFAGDDPEQTPEAGQTGAVAHPRAKSEESLEWEVPGDRLAPESASSGVDDQKEDGVEDVLEETPDFLRDTPEQERLWFEQRPPRNFDFNE